MYYNYGICHRLKECSVSENIITGKENIIEHQALVRKTLKSNYALMASEMPFFVLANYHAFVLREV